MPHHCPRLLLPILRRQQVEAKAHPDDQLDCTDGLPRTRCPPQLDHFNRKIWYVALHARHNYCLERIRGYKYRMDNLFHETHRQARSRLP